MNERILCRHCDEQRTITGSWCTPELQKVVEGGYRILKIHEVWHWPEDKRKTGFFHPTWTPGLNTKQRRVDGLTIVTHRKRKTSMSLISKHKRESSWKRLRKILGGNKLQSSC